MKFCFTTIVHGENYVKYAPYFIYSCLKAYPDSFVKLFFTGEIPQKYHKIYNHIKSIGNFKIEQNCFSDYSKKNQSLKSIRWIISEIWFKDYSHIYIGDVDIFICQENPTLLEQHVKHCKEQNLPYSNMVRPNSTRLSGLHFIEREKYYLCIESVRQKYVKLLKENKLNDTNEVMLYRMIKESGMEFPNNQWRPHHGLHLGMWRKGARVLSKEKWVGVGGRESYRVYWEWFKKIENDPVLKLIEKTHPIKEIAHMRQSMEREFK